MLVCTQALEKNTVIGQENFALSEEGHSIHIWPLKNVPTRLDLVKLEEFGLLTVPK